MITHKADFSWTGAEVVAAHLDNRIAILWLRTVGMGKQKVQMVDTLGEGYTKHEKTLWFDIIVQGVKTRLYYDQERESWLLVLSSTDGISFP